MVGFSTKLLCGVLALCILLFSSFTLGVNVDVQSDGTLLDIDDEGVVTFANNYNNLIHLFWEGADGKPVKMAVLSRSGSVGLNTFPNHVFFATFDAEATQRVNPRQVRYYIIDKFTSMCFNNSAARFRSSWRKVWIIMPLDLCKVT